MQCPLMIDYNTQRMTTSGKGLDNSGIDLRGRAGHWTPVHLRHFPMETLLAPTRALIAMMC